MGYSQSASFLLRGVGELKPDNNLLDDLTLLTLGPQLRGGANNRRGEAEKSHQKARKRGYTECWTVVNVEDLDMEKAKAESPSTDRFYALAPLLRREGPAFEDFRRRLISLTAIAPT